MARTRARNTEGTFKADDKSTPEVNEAWVEETPAPENAKEPVNIEVQTPSDEPVPAPAAVAPEKIQTDFREKLLNKDVDQNIFIPSNPVALEKAANAVAEQKGFELNRGTSIGARLMARANKSV